jgi:hypothetical protein
MLTPETEIDKCGELVKQLEGENNVSESNRYLQWQPNRIYTYTLWANTPHLLNFKADYICS